MKKLVALALALVMVLALVACGGKEEPTPVAADKLKVCLLCTTLGDQSFNDSADAGLKAMDTIEYTAVEFGTENNTNQDRIYQELTEAAEEYDVVICNNLGYGIAGEWLAANAETYPETNFIVYDEPEVAAPAANVVMLGFRANESDFLAGALAAMVSETGKIGFVGGMESTVIYDFLVGYIEGAQYVNPDIQVSVMYTQSYSDAVKGKEIGTTMLDLGCDVIHGVAGGAGNGALEAAAEAGKYAIGVDSDQYVTLQEGAPETAARVITSSLKDVGKALQVVIGTMQDGTFEGGQTLWFGAAEGCSGIAENENYVALTTEEQRAQMEEVKAALANGEATCDSGIGMPVEEINALVESVAVK